MKLKKLLLSSMLVATATITLASCGKKKPSKPADTTDTPVTTTTPVETEKDAIEKIEEFDVTEAIETLENWLVDNYLNISRTETKYDKVTGKVKTTNSLDVQVSYNQMIEAYWNTTSNSALAENTSGHLFNAIAEDITTSNGTDSTGKTSQEENYEYSPLDAVTPSSPIEKAAQEFLKYILTNDILKELKNSDINKYKDAAFALIKPYLSIEETSGIPYVDPAKVAEASEGKFSLESIVALYAPLQEKGFFSMEVNSDTMTISFKLNREAINEYLTKMQAEEKTIGDVIEDIYGSEVIDKLNALTSESNAESINKAIDIIKSILASIEFEQSMVEDFTAETLFSVLETPVVVDQITPIIDMIDVEFGNTEAGTFDVFVRFPMPGEEELMNACLSAQYNPETKDFHAVVAPAMFDEENKKYVPVEAAAMATVSYNYFDEMDENPDELIWELDIDSALLGMLFADNEMFKDLSGLKATYSQELMYELEETPIGTKDVYNFIIKSGDETMPLASLSLNNYNDGEKSANIVVMGGMFEATFKTNEIEAILHAESGSKKFNLVYDSENPEYQHALTLTIADYDSSEKLLQTEVYGLYNNDNVIKATKSKTVSEKDYSNEEYVLTFKENGLSFTQSSESSYLTTVGSGKVQKIDTYNTQVDLAYEDSELTFDVASTKNDLPEFTFNAVASLADKKITVDQVEYDAGKKSNESNLVIEISQDGNQKQALEDKVEADLAKTGKDGILGKTISEIYSDTTLDQVVTVNGNEAAATITLKDNVLSAAGKFNGYSSKVRCYYTADFTATADFNNAVSYNAIIEKTKEENETLRYYAYGKGSINVTTLYSSEFDNTLHYVFAYDVKTKEIYIADNYHNYAKVATYEGSVSADDLTAARKKFEEFIADIDFNTLNEAVTSTYSSRGYTFKFSTRTVS